MSDKPTLVPAPQLAARNQAHVPGESPAYRAARNALLIEEIELRRHLERVAAQRRALPPAARYRRTSALLRRRARSGYRRCSVSTTR